MLGLVQNDKQLLISSLIDHAELNHGEVEIVSRTVENPAVIHRSTWRQVALRAKQVAHSLDSLSLPFSSRVGTIAWNGYRHLECAF
jgi:acyl-CoA synthetase (AMP-forming)/AMP-acid ligase II